MNQLFGPEERRARVRTALWFGVESQIDPVELLMLFKLTLAQSLGFAEYRRMSLLGLDG